MTSLQHHIDDPDCDQNCPDILMIKPLTAVNSSELSGGSGFSVPMNELPGKLCTPTVSGVGGFHGSHRTTLLSHKRAGSQLSTVTVLPPMPPQPHHVLPEPQERTGKETGPKWGHPFYIYIHTYIHIHICIKLSKKKKE